MTRLLGPNVDQEVGAESYESDESRRSSLSSFYRIERTQYCRGYAYVSFALFFFTFFIFFIKVADCSSEDCLANQADPWNWTLQCMIAMGSVCLFCFLLGVICLKIAKYREKHFGYQPI